MGEPWKLKESNLEAGELRLTAANLYDYGLASALERAGYDETLATLPKLSARQCDALERGYAEGMRVRDLPTNRKEY